MSQRTLFGTDGVRGVANQQLTPELAMQLAMAAATVLRHAEHPLVLIGKDTRQSGDMLEMALAAGFASAGCDVHLLGVVPTPAVAWLVRHEGAMMGAMISASHNPAPDNGIKFFAGTGSKLPDATELEIEKVIAQQNWLRVTGPQVGRVSQAQPAEIEPYLQGLIASVSQPLKGLRVVLDTAHGAMFELAPRVFQALGVEFELLHAAPTGMNINEGCGSTHLEPLRQAVQAGGYDLGLAFDGDGDRCLAVGPQGQDIDGDAILYLCSRYLPAYQSESAVVATVMSNLGLEKALQASNKQLIRAAVGDRYVLEAMQAGPHKLGGEQSGHVIFHDLQVTGDGLLTALQLLSAVQASGKPVAEVLSEIQTYPQLLKNVVVQPQWHHRWPEHPGLQAAIRQAEQTLAGNGRLLVRASGTEPKLRVMAEGQDPQLVEQVVGQLTALIQQEMSA